MVDISLGHKKSRNLILISVEVRSMNREVGYDPVVPMLPWQHIDMVEMAIYVDLCMSAQIWICLNMVARWWRGGWWCGEGGLLTVHVVMTTHWHSRNAHLWRSLYQCPNMVICLNMVVRWWLGGCHNCQHTSLTADMVNYGDPVVQSNRSGRYVHMVMYICYKSNAQQ